MERPEAFALLTRHLGNRNLINHSLAVEACMRSMADHFREDPDRWGLAGLLHDLDYETTVNDPGNHTLETARMLEPFRLPPEVIHAIMGHNHKAELKSKMDHSLYAIDPTTGFIVAVALMHPSKSLEAATLKRMKKRFRESSFAKGASRDQIKTCEQIGMELDEFLIICRDAMLCIHSELGL